MKMIRKFFNTYTGLKAVCYFCLCIFLNCLLEGKVSPLFYEHYINSSRFVLLFNVDRCQLKSILQRCSQVSPSPQLLVQFDHHSRIRPPSRHHLSSTLRHPAVQFCNHWKLVVISSKKHSVFVLTNSF